MTADSQVCSLGDWVEGGAVHRNEKTEGRTSYVGRCAYFGLVDFEGLVEN